MNSAERRAAYIARVVAEAPPLTPAQFDRLAGIFSPGETKTRAYTGPSESELRRQKEADERAHVLKELRRRAKALTACHGCGLQPEQHVTQSAYGMGYHEWEPIKVET